MATAPVRGEIPERREWVVTRPGDLPACCEYIAAAGRFGLDTEFVGEDTFHPHLCLVQVATPERLIIIDPLSAGNLEAFWKLVTDPAHQVIVHAGREEVRLCRVWTGQPPRNLVDLQIAAGLVGLNYPIGHAGLVSQLLGIQLAKGETLTEWRNRPLTPAQIRYAFDDVRYVLPLWDRLAGRLDALGRADWAREEFDRMVREAMGDEPARERWRRLRGLGSLSRPALAVVRELYTWREETAERTNRPARAVARDDLLVEIARRMPRRERDLQIIRGLPRRDLSAIVDVVARAAALPPAEWPAQADRDVDPPQVHLIGNVLGAVLGDFCARHHLAPSLVASTTDLRAVVRAHLQGVPPPADVPLARGWRGAHVLPELLAVLQGRRALRIADARADAPFAYEERNAEPAPPAHRPA